MLFANPREIRKYQAELDEWNGPIVFCSPVTLKSFRGYDLLWRKMKKYFLRNDVVFCDMHMGEDHFAKMIEIAKQGEANYKHLFDGRREDIKKIGKLLHDLEPNKSESTKSSAILEAEREFGLKGKDVDTVEFLKNLLVEIESRTEETTANIEGLACDVEGTLLVGEEINSKVLEMLRESEKEGKSVTLWTGGDVEKLSAKLRQLGVEYPVVSKYDYRWGEAEMVIDDLAQAEFSERYKIFPKKYHQI